jgi:carboxyl-terminal processing protease
MATAAFTALWVLGCLVGMLHPAAAAGDSAAPIDPQAVETLEKDGLFFPSGSIPDFASAQAFKAYLLQKDPYADFLAREEYARFRKMLQDEQSAGIGLELERDRTGRISCYPDPEGPAARAGVAAGDELVAIDGHPVQGKALPTLVAMAAGEAGSPLTIDIARKDRTTRRLTVVRTRSVTASVIEQRYGARSVIRVAYFTPNTRQELEFILLTNLNRVDPVILDLRGNRGGDLNAAIDCAMLFLDRGATVVSVRGRRDTHAYVSSIAGPARQKSVLLLQDEETASAAEVFIAALTENGRAVSIGRKTFGKGTRQDLIALRSGAVLILTTGYLLTPSGKAVEGGGLAPDCLLPPDAADIAKYLEKADRLLGTRRKPACH